MLRVCSIVVKRFHIFRHKLYLFDNVPCGADGIIGLDFLRNYNAKIDLPTNRLTLQLNYYETCTLKTIRRINKNIDSKEYLTIPSRSESIHYLSISKNLYKDCVIYPKQLHENVFLAGCIVKPNRGKIPVKIMNTDEKPIKILKSNIIQSKDIDYLENYDLCSFSKSQKDVNRVKKLLTELKLNHLDPTDKKSLQIICAKYSDIFFLEGDKLGTANVVEQSIMVKPDTKPVYKAKQTNK